ncbi:MAG TPA: S24 family peptidase [Thermoanaerobaculia bacterium]|nr:S24 family peptidase [Thermoanaerobaculia bacterium]
MDVIERLHLAVKASGLPKKLVAHRAGMSASRLSRLLNGRLKRPSLPDIEAVLRAIDKRMDDLYRDKETVGVRQALRALTQFVDLHDAVPAPAPGSFAATPLPRPKVQRSRTVRAYPVAATPNAEIFDSGEYPRKKIPPALWARGARHAARAVGDSMIDAGIRSGDVVFFAPATSRQAARGKIVVIRVNTADYVKYYNEVDGQKLLLSAKAGLRPMILKSDDEVKLHGIVVLPRSR